MRWLCLAGSALLIALCGCSAQDRSSTGGATASASTGGAAESPADGETSEALVGNWRRTTTCEERAQALEDAGLGEFAAEHAAGEGWIPGVTSVDQLADPSHPCRGAVPLDHEHFFTPSGQFGSLDANGNQVDDGSYDIQDPQTLVVHKEFGDLTFTYTVTGDTLSLIPELPPCGAEGCFAAQWAVAVSYNGLPWKRVD